MLVSQLSITHHPAIQFTDKIYTAIQLMEDYDVQHLPVVNNDQFAGMLVKADLLEMDEEAAVQLLENRLIRQAVLDTAFFTEAIKIANLHQLSLVAVVNEQQQLSGTLTLEALLRAVGQFMSVEEPGGIIVLELDKRHYSFGEISRLVETNDAYITQLNTSVDAETGLTRVFIKINKYEISDVVSTFQRYDYNVLYFFGEQLYENELKQNYDLLMTYLRV
jgi:acetoin utilization protein AcuB